MKNLGLTVVAIAFSATVFAAGTSSKNDQKWNGTIHTSSLKKYLNLDGEQHEEVTNICEHFEKEMRVANSTKKNKEEKLRKAVYSNLKLMKQTLNEQQYASYIRALSTTLRNKGISF